MAEKDRLEGGWGDQADKKSGAIPLARDGPIFRQPAWLPSNSRLPAVNIQTGCSSPLKASDVPNPKLLKTGLFSLKQSDPGCPEARQNRCFRGADYVFDAY